MASEDTSYTLTSDDLTAFAHIVGVQGDVGAYNPTGAGLEDLVRRLYWCSFNYAGVSNARVRQYLETFYGGLILSGPQPPVPALLVAYMWALFAQDESRWDSFWAGDEGPVTWENWSDKCPAISPANWSEAVRQQLNDPSIVGNDAAVIWFPSSQKEASDHRRAIIDHELRLLHPANWTDADKADVGKLAKNTPTLWTEQSQDLATLTSAAPLSGQACLYLLHLLAGLCTFPDDREQDDREQPAVLTRVNAIAKHGAISPEYPNDTFISQLVYFALMELADPEGSYQRDHDQLAGALATLAAAVPNRDQGSVVLRKTFAQHAAILSSAKSYPIHDPYNSGVGYLQRKKDTLEALNAAWRDLKPQPSRPGEA